MSKTLLDGVNEVGKSAGWLDSFNTGLLTSLTSSNVQREIDITVQIINEGIDELFRGRQDAPSKSAESTLTLATNTREYTLASDLITLKWPMTDRTNTQFLNQWSDSYQAFLLLDPQQLYTGLPVWALISPINGKLRVDRAPSSAENGRIYTYEYNRNTVLTGATDAMPFNDEAFRAMVRAWTEMYNRVRKKEFDQALYAQGLARAAEAAREELPRDHYSPRGAPVCDWL